MKKLTQIFAAATLAGIAAIPALNAQVLWTSEYTGDALPNEAPSDPLWTLNAGGSQSAGVSGGILTVTTDNASSYRFYNVTGGAGQDWNPTMVGSTLELRMKVNSIASTYAQKLTVLTGSTNYSFAWTDNAFMQLISGAPNPEAFYALEATEYNVYRFTIDDTNALSLYINNNPTPVFAEITGPATGDAGIYFGSLGWGNEAGSTDWDYIRWTNAGAFAPVPEPASLALLGLAAGALLLRRKRQA